MMQCVEADCLGILKGFWLCSEGDGLAGSRLAGWQVGSKGAI